MALVVPEGFQHIHRVMNTNIDGNRKVPYALTAIKGAFLIFRYCCGRSGVGRRYAFAVCRKADITVHKRAGELSEEDVSFIFCFRGAGVYDHGL